MGRSPAKRMSSSAISNCCWIRGLLARRLVQVHALIYDSIEYDVLNRVYRQYVANGPPARTVWTAQIEAGFKVQLDVIAAA